MAKQLGARGHKPGQAKQLPNLVNIEPGDTNEPGDPRERTCEPGDATAIPRVQELRTRGSAESIKVGEITTISPQPRVEKSRTRGSDEKDVEPGDAKITLTVPTRFRSLSTLVTSVGQSDSRFGVPLSADGFVTT